MNRAFCILVILSTLVLSGCGIKLFTNKVDVECTTDNSTIKAEPPRIGSFVDQKNLPSKTLTARPPKPPTDENRSRFFLPPDGPESSCRVDEKTAEAIAQITSSSCWAASAETTMRYHTTSPDPSQCDIIGTIAGKDVGNPVDCCSNLDQGNCQRNGLPSWAFEEYGFNWLMVQGPLEREKLAAQLCSNGPFIFLLRYSGGGGHSFVVRDYFYDEDTKELSLWVHDHSWTSTDLNEQAPTPTPYELWTYEDYEAGRWEGEVHTHDINYVYITSPTER